jgi:4-amino-4-deoxychorismate lyase
MSESGTFRGIPRTFVNGALLPSTHAAISISDQGLLYGLGFFETFRSSGGKPHLWTFHCDRLTKSCEKVGINIPRTFLALDRARLLEVMAELSKEAGVVDAVFRYTVTAGVNGRPSEFLSVRPLPEDAPAAGINLRVLKTRRDSGEWIPRPKSVNYINAMLGVRELVTRHAGSTDDGLFLSHESNLVVETPRQSLIWVSGGRIHIADEDLGGVSSTCVSWLQHHGVPLTPTKSTLLDFAHSQAVVCVNAVRGITPVREIWNAGDTEKIATLASATHARVLDFQAAWKQALAQTAGM